MTGYTPPKIEDAPKSFIGVGTRELVTTTDRDMLRKRLSFIRDFAAGINVPLTAIPMFLTKYKKAKSFIDQNGVPRRSEHYYLDLGLIHFIGNDEKHPFNAAIASNAENKAITVPEVPELLGIKPESADHGGEDAEIKGSPELTDNQEAKSGELSEVANNGNKAAITTILINSKLMEIVREWDNLVRSQCPPDSSWYARLDSGGNLDPRAIIPMTIENKDELKIKARNPYSGFRKDLQKVCKMAGVVYKSPHKARYGHIHLGFSKAKTTEERKAISLNAMHGSLAITDAVYDRMSSDHANKILLSFNFDEKNSSENENVTDNQDSASKSADVNEMMINLLLSMDPEMLIQIGRFMKMMRKDL